MTLPVSDYTCELARPIKAMKRNEILLCSHSRYDVPPVPQRNVSIAAERGAVRPSIAKVRKSFYRPSNETKQMGMKIYTNELGHMTNMVVMPIYGKNLKKSSSPEPIDQ